MGRVEGRPSPGGCLHADRSHNDSSRVQVVEEVREGELLVVFCVVGVLSSKGGWQGIVVDTAPLPSRKGSGKSKGEWRSGRSGKASKSSKGSPRGLCLLDTALARVSSAVHGRHGMQGREAAVLVRYSSEESVRLHCVRQCQKGKLQTALHPS